MWLNDTAKMSEQMNRNSILQLSTPLPPTSTLKLPTARSSIHVGNHAAHGYSIHRSAPQIYSIVDQGRRLYVFRVFIEYPLNFGSGCTLMFSVNLTFGETLIMQFCYFFRKNCHFRGYKCVTIHHCAPLMFLLYCIVYHTS